MRFTFSCAVLACAVVAATGTAAAQALSTPAEVEAFFASLESCTPAKAATPYPLMRSFVSEHVIDGEKDGLCAYSQTMPGKMKILCTLSADGRKGLASDLRSLVAGGFMKGATPTTLPAWTTECEFELPDGRRIPAGSGPGGK